VTRPSVLERFEAKYVPEPMSGCWLWIASLRETGYGRFYFKGHFDQAHRVAYEIFKKKIPSGLTLDHLCRTRSCVNPAHLEPVTLHENNRRGFSPAALNARKTQCVRGHVLDDRRRCVICKRLSDRRRAPSRVVTKQLWRTRRRAMGLHVS